MALEINSADPAQILMFHDSITPQIARAIVKHRPDNGYKNLRELEALNTDLMDVDWDKLEPLLDFKVPDEFANRWLNIIAQNYGTPSPTSSKGRKAVPEKVRSGSGNDLGEVVLKQIKKRYGD